MSRLIRTHHKYFAVTFLLVFFIAGRPEEFGKETQFFQGFLIQKPVIRVALGVNLEDILVHASSGMKIYLASEGYKLIADDASEARIKGQKEKLTEKFLVQVGQSRRLKDAEDLARELREKIRYRIEVTEDRQNELDGVYQVRVGDFLTRTDALAFIKEANAAGITDTWIHREEVTEPVSKPQWVLLNDELVNIGSDNSVYMIPSNPESFLTYDGKNYRGLFIVRGSPRGTLLINILNIEDYLKGVVPGELSPLAFGEIEALKAQAIAARTYALKNLGQFDDHGFDLFDTPVSQVYNGMSIENPLSTRAVDETRGRVAVYDGKLINALYTSTCGGATEDVENVFGGNPVPYLKSTECTLEKDDVWMVATSVVMPPVFVQGAEVSPRLAALSALGVLPADLSAAEYNAPVSASEFSDWTRRTVALIGGKVEQPFREGAEINFASAARYLVGAFSWGERARNLVARAEFESAVGALSGLAPEERPALGYFVVCGLYPPFCGPSGWSRAMTRAEAALTLAKAVSTYRDFAHQGYVKGFGGNTLDLVEDGEPKTFEVARNAFLFRTFSDSISIAPSVGLTGGDVVRWIERDGKIRFLQVMSAPISTVLDNPSQYSHWQVRISREELEARIGQFYPMGRLLDVVPQKRGSSKRVTELAIVGQEGQVKVSGMKVRQVLNLRDNLFVIDRELDEKGRVTHFVFSGRGWGHGVGLCQVGAFRMAQKGYGCEEILKKYYRGIKLTSWY